MQAIYKKKVLMYYASEQGDDDLRELITKVKNRLCVAKTRRTLIKVIKSLLDTKFRIVTPMILTLANKTHPEAALVDISAAQADRMKIDRLLMPIQTRDRIRSRLIGAPVEADFEVAGMVMSLKCPLGQMRMTAPCRSTSCKHIQCFDAAVFLRINEQKPTWICPICGIPAKYAELMIDGYFLEVLTSPLLPPNDMEIALNGDGTWNRIQATSEERRSPDIKLSTSSFIDLTQTDSD